MSKKTIPVFRKKLSKFLTWWQKQNFVKFIGVFLLLSFIAKMAIGGLFLFPFFSIEDEPFGADRLAGSNLLFGIISLVILVPILETFLFQQLPISVVSKFSKNKYLQVFVSAVLFGITHPYSLLYIIYTIFAGIVLATGFILYKEVHGTRKAFCVTALVHGLVNLVAVLAIIFFPEER